MGNGLSSFSTDLLIIHRDKDFMLFSDAFRIVSNISREVIAIVAVLSVGHGVYERQYPFTIAGAGSHRQHGCLNGLRFDVQEPSVELDADPVVHIKTNKVNLPATNQTYIHKGTALSINTEISFRVGFPELVLWFWQKRL